MSLAATLSGCSGRGIPPEGSTGELVYVGTQDRQIQALRFDPSTGKLAVIAKVAEGARSTWVAAHPVLPVIYAVDDDNAKEGSVTAYAVNRTTGALERINEVATRGSGTTNLYLDVPSMTLLAANYGGGSVSSITVKPDGSLGLLVSTVKDIGSGPNRRQATAHAHSAVVDPSGRYALVPDLGADRVFVYGFDRGAHSLSADDAVRSRSFVAPAGSGPRHIAFGASGQYVYVISELSAEIMVFRWDTVQGRLALLQSLPVSSETFKGTRSGAEIAVSGDGRFVYAENRAEDSLSVYRVDANSGQLSLVQRVASGGERPWGFGIDRSGKWMLVANQRSGTVNVFGIDTASGKLSDIGQTVSMPTPVSIAFVN
ncbi:lactonase family protein [Burkholderia sp. WSM2232]|uniref:lactonase family protein n=1 Tax=Burkholderia sp. WSM2232 TaxID=944436 RepID=UPI000487E10E|nr:lactonase family protein [Burkholderia sp. WSM2232]